MSLKDYGIKWRRKTEGKKITHTLVFNDLNNNPEDDEIISTIEVAGNIVVSKYEDMVVDRAILPNNAEAKEYAVAMKAQIGRDTLIMQEH